VSLTAGTRELQILTEVREMTWADQALCAEVGGDEWFPEKGDSTRNAKAVCRRCEVRQACLTYALEHDERFGIYGGLTERERRDLKRARKREAA
jgi:WhiB family transcriptional regulator, redox-sensing transcriptional regulator